jgi:hypothetical protein
MSKTSVHPADQPSAPKKTMWLIAALWIPARAGMKIESGSLGHLSHWDYAAWLGIACCIYLGLLRSAGMQLFWGGISAWLVVITTLSRTGGRNAEEVARSPLLQWFEPAAFATIAYLLLVHAPIRTYRAALNEFDVLPPPKAVETAARGPDSRPRLVR